MLAASGSIAEPDVTAPACDDALATLHLGAGADADLVEIAYWSLVEDLHNTPMDERTRLKGLEALNVARSTLEGAEQDRPRHAAPPAVRVLHARLRTWARVVTLAIAILVPAATIAVLLSQGSELLRVIVGGGIAAIAGAILARGFAIRAPMFQPPVVLSPDDAFAQLSLRTTAPRRLIEQRHDQLRRQALRAGDGDRLHVVDAATARALDAPSAVGV